MYVDECVSRSRLFLTFVSANGLSNAFCFVGPSKYTHKLADVVLEHAYFSYTHSHIHLHTRIFLSRMFALCCCVLRFSHYLFSVALCVE